ncbi:MAG: maleylpyruvate isomerase family mycothiol-dependent enzyme [Ilumatobacter sp.]|nr:maleylpyruvate isomerase family mycothiol-dependent enzyme [Ilumatobacter sp.]
MAALPFNATEHIRIDGEQLVDAILRAGLDTPVPSCEGWTMGDLAWHIGETWEFWMTVVKDGITDVEVLKQLPDLDRPADDDLVDFAVASHTGLLSALTDTPPDTEVWTWTGANRDAAWVRRRMAHETAVHRWDAEAAVGDPYRVPIAMAADGIEEFLQYFSWRGRDEPLGGTVHLHCTDTDRDVNTGSDDISAVGGEWIIHRLDPDGIDFDHAHAKGDTAIRGEANDLLLWLWGRDAGPVEILGDTAVAEQFRAGSLLN